MVVEIDGWRHVKGELRIRCRTTDGARVLPPAAWTDLPTNGPQEPASHPALVATPEGWRRFAEVLDAVGDRRPSGARGWRRNRGGRDVGSADVDVGEESLVPAAVWETLPPHTRTMVTVMLARLLAASIEEAGDE